MTQRKPASAAATANHFENRWKKSDVAAFLGCNERTVDRLRIPRVPIEVEPGKRPMIRFDPAEVREWWEIQKKKRSR